MLALRLAATRAHPRDGRDAPKGSVASVAVESMRRGARPGGL